MMLKFLKRIGFVVLLFVVVSTIISAGSLWSLRQSSFYKPSFIASNVKAMNFDYLILGSSTGLTTLNTNVIDSTLQTTGINLAMDNTSVSSQYLMLQHFLAQGKTTKFCVLATTTASFDSENKDISANDYRFLPFISSNYVYQYFKQFTSTSASLMSNSKWMPMLGVSYYNAEIFYPSLLSLVKPEKRNRFDATGNYTYPKTKNTAEKITVFQDLPIALKNEYIAKIKTLCELNNIQLICYFSPHEGKKVIANNSNYTIINHSDLLKNTNYFYDTVHVNSDGRQLCSLTFAQDFEAFKNK